MQRRELWRVAEELARLSCAGQDSVIYRHEAMQQIARIVPSEAWCWTTADPSTGLVTGAIGEGIPPDRSPRFFEIEYLVDDFNKFSDLAYGAQQAGVLSEATAGRLELSPRHREIFGPLGIGEDVRIALRANGGCWGYLVLHRHPAHPFIEDEVAFLLSVAGRLAIGLRLSLINASNAPLAAGQSGLVMLDGELNTVAITPAAERYLAMMHSKVPHQPGRLPDGVHALVASLLSTSSADSSYARSRVPAEGGKWLSLQATRLSPGNIGGLIAVMIQPADPSELVPLILQGSGLTAREVEVAGCVLRGLSTREIVSDLSVSPETVQQHLKSVFDKLGVRSRREMLATLFLRHYWPRMATGTPIGPDGWFADGVHATATEPIAR